MAQLKPNVKWNSSHFKMKERKRFYIKKKIIHAKKGRLNFLAHTTMREKI